MWTAKGQGWARGQHLLWRFYWVGVVGQNAGFAHSVTLSSKGHTHKECDSGKISDTEEDELLIRQGRREGRRKAPKPSSRRRSWQSPESWVQPILPGRCLFVARMCCTCAQLEPSLYSGSRTMRTCRAAPRAFESPCLADTGLTRTLESLLLSAASDTLKSKTKPRRQMEKSSAPGWKCKATPAYCYTDCQPALGETCHIKSTRDQRFGSLSLAFIGPFKIPWRLKSEFSRVIIKTKGCSGCPVLSPLACFRGE